MDAKNVYIHKRKGVQMLAIEIVSHEKRLQDV